MSGEGPKATAETLGDSGQPHENVPSIILIVARIVARPAHPNHKESTIGSSQEKT